MTVKLLDMASRVCAAHLVTHMRGSTFANAPLRIAPSAKISMAPCFSPATFSRRVAVYFLHQHSEKGSMNDEAHHSRPGPFPCGARAKEHVCGRRQYRRCVCAGGARARRLSPPDRKLQHASRKADLLARADAHRTGLSRPIRFRTQRRCG